MRIYVAESLSREKVTAGLRSDAVRLDDAGRYGGSLSFAAKSSAVVFFQGRGNLPAARTGFQGAFSFWLRLDPDLDLPPGYVDPLQVTDKKWNDASFFVDFTENAPRQFRMGVFSDYPFWNPQDLKWEAIAEVERPMATVVKPPFLRDQWTHVALTFHHFNVEAEPGIATLYLNGESQGEVRRKQQFTWDEQKLALMLGIGYVGRIDDLAVFDRALTSEEVKGMLEWPQGVKSLREN